MKKRMCMLLAAVLLVTLCAGCSAPREEQTPPSGIFYDLTGIAPDETLLTVSGNAIPAELYFYWTSYTCSALEYQIGMYNSYYGYYSELIDSETGSLLWDAAFGSTGGTLSDYAREQAKNTVAFYASVENLARENGAELSEEDEKALTEEKASTIEELGGQEAFLSYLEKLSISEAGFDRVNRDIALFDKLVDQVMEEGSPLYLEPVDYDQYATYADHILLATVDLTTGAALSEEEIAAKRATAEELLEQLRAAEDVAALFTQLADEYSEDTGRASNPAGYIYTPGTMVAAFEDAAAALAPGQISDIVESSYGYHIILRRDLWQGLTENPEQRASLAEQHLGDLVSLAAQEAEIEESAKLEGFDAGAFYTDYIAAVTALNEAEQQAAGDGADDAGAGDSTGDGSDTGEGQKTE